MFRTKKLLNVAMAVTDTRLYGALKKNAKVVLKGVLIVALIGYIVYPVLQWGFTLKALTAIGTGLSFGVAMAFFGPNYDDKWFEKNGTDLKQLQKAFKKARRAEKVLDFPDIQWKDTAQSRVMEALIALRVIEYEAVRDFFEGQIESLDEDDIESIGLAVKGFIDSLYTEDNRLSLGETGERYKILFDVWYKTEHGDAIDKATLFYRAIEARVEFEKEVLGVKPEEREMANFLKWVLRLESSDIRPLAASIILETIGESTSLLESVLRSGFGEMDAVNALVAKITEKHLLDDRKLITDILTKAKDNLPSHFEQILTNVEVSEVSYEAKRGLEKLNEFFATFPARILMKDVPKRRI